MFIGRMVAFWRECVTGWWFQPLWKILVSFSTFPLAAAVSRAAMTEACLACFVHLNCTTYAPPTAKDGVWTLHGRHMVLCVPITCWKYLHRLFIASMAPGRHGLFLKPLTAMEKPNGRRALTSCIWIGDSIPFNHHCKNLIQTRDCLDKSSLNWSASTESVLSAYTLSLICTGTIMPVSSANAM